MYSSMADDLIMGYFLLLLCLIVVNDYTQSYDSGKGRKLAYEALRKVFRKIKQNFSGLRIAYQAIDAGLAGGHLEIMAKIIEEESAGEDHTCVIFQL